MSSAALAVEVDDVLLMADAALSRLSLAHFDTAGQSIVRLQTAAQRVGVETDRDLAIDSILDALSEIESSLRPIGQSVAIRIVAVSKTLVLEREVQVKANHPLVLNAVEMHLASLIMAVKRRMICGKLPIAANLLSNLSALRVQLPALNEPVTKEPEFADAGDIAESPKQKVIESWTERLARRFTGR